MTLLLRTLLQAGLLPIFFYYDINCRWSAHFRGWAAGAGAEGALAMDLVEWIRTGMAYPVPPFHIHMHNASCQALNNALMMLGAGCGVGEPPEQLWSHFRPLGTIMQYCSLPARQNMMERLMQRININSRWQLVNRAVRMFYRALEQQRLASAMLQTLHMLLGQTSATPAEVRSLLVLLLGDAYCPCPPQPTPNCSSSTFGCMHPLHVQVQDILHARRPPHAQALSEALNVGAEYVELLQQLAIITSSNESAADMPLELLVRGRAGDQLKETSAYVKRTRARKQQLEAAHPELREEAWGRDTQCYKYALFELAAHRMRQQQNAVVKTHMDLALLDLFMQDIAGRRTITAKLRQNRTVSAVRCNVTQRVEPAYLQPHVDDVAADNSAEGDQELERRAHPPPAVVRSHPLCQGQLHLSAHP